METIIQTSLRSLKNNKLRSFLTMLGIVIGIASIILIMSIGTGATAAITDQLSNFGTNYFRILAGNLQDASAFSGSVRTLTLEDVEAIESEIANVESASPTVIGTFLVTANEKEDNVLVGGVSPEYFDIIKPDVRSGRLLEQGDVIGYSRVAVLGSDVAEDYFGVETDPTGETIRIGGKPFQVVGVLESTSFVGAAVNNGVFVPTQVAMRQILGQDHLFQIQVAVTDERFIYQTIDDVEALLRDRHDIAEGVDSDFTIQSFLDGLMIVQTVIGLVTALVAAVSAISLLVGGIGIMNIMLVTVTERTREIGLLKAIGARERDILVQFLIEALILTLIGALVGITIGLGGAYMITRIAGIPFIVSFGSIIIGVTMATVVGLVFGMYPARQAAKLNPIDAIKHE